MCSIDDALSEPSATAVADGTSVALNEPVFPFAAVVSVPDELYQKY
jgi:hypothetical protein